MRRTPSQIDNTALRVDVLQNNDGSLFGALRSHDDYVWACDHRHREPGAARRCVVREVRRWALERTS